MKINKIKKAEIEELVSIFYRPAFKTFYVSKDDKHPLSRVGVFVSIGITSSLKTLEYVKESIESTGEYKADLCEIVSYFTEDDMYVNLINKLGDEIKDQYKINSLTVEEGTVLEREEALKELAYKKEIGSDTESIQKLIDKLDTNSGWTRHAILKSFSGDYSLYHKYVNYISKDGKDYRLGIFVSKKL